MTIWVNLNSDWNYLWGKHILEEVDINFELTKLVWKFPCKVLCYNSLFLFDKML